MGHMSDGTSVSLEELPQFPGVGCHGGSYCLRDPSQLGKAGRQTPCPARWDAPRSPVLDCFLCQASLHPWDTCLWPGKLSC